MSTPDNNESGAEELLLGFTTVETRDEAEKLGREAMDSGLAACIQIDAPVTSYFLWEGKRHEAVEHRLLFKFVSGHRRALEAWIQRHHPYDTPEWIVVAADHTAEKYLQWAREVTK